MGKGSAKYEMGFGCDRYYPRMGEIRLKFVKTICHGCVHPRIVYGIVYMAVNIVISPTRGYAGEYPVSLASLNNFRFSHYNARVGLLSIGS